MQNLVYVPVTNAPGPAVLCRADHERLSELGVGSGWFWADSGNGFAYVRCNRRAVGEHLETVARLIVGAAEGETVKYRDRDRLNLTRGNLKVYRRAKAQCRSIHHDGRGSAHGFY